MEELSLVVNTTNPSGASRAEELPLAPYGRATLTEELSPADRLFPSETLRERAKRSYAEGYTLTLYADGREAMRSAIHRR